MTALAIKSENRIDHVLDNLRASDLSILGNVAHDDEHRSARLCKRNERLHAGANLANGAGRGLDALRPKRLDRIDDNEVRCWPLLYGCKDTFDARFSNEAEGGFRKPESRGPQPDLVCCFLAREIKRTMPLGRNGRRRLKQKR